MKNFEFYFCELDKSININYILNVDELIYFYYKDKFLFEIDLDCYSDDFTFSEICNNQELIGELFKDAMYSSCMSKENIEILKECVCGDE